MDTPSHPDDERALRVQLAACYRIFSMLGWTELIYNHVTVRVPGPGRHFLINPFGLRYDEVTASNLVKIDLDGRVVDGSTHRVNPAGFVLHSTIHAGIDDAHCVMHTHTTAGCAVAGSAAGLSWTTSTRRSSTGASRTTTSRASPCTPTRARACCARSARTPR